MAYRSVFLSDVHLGHPACQADLLADFLAGHPAEHLFLVGDIVDFAAMATRPYWHPGHSRILRTILGMARRGTRVTYIPGNHDRQLRAFAGRCLGPVAVERFLVHTGADGRRHLLLHGDEMDGLMDRGGLRSRLGAAAYRGVIRLNTRINAHRRARNRGYLPLAAALKHRIGSAREYMDRFREHVVATARGVGVDGVVCGHIHRPEITDINGLAYHNTGDWVENCSALVEHADGRLQLVAQGDGARRLERWRDAEAVPAT